MEVFKKLNQNEKTSKTHSIDGLCIGRGSTCANPKRQQRFKEF
jgi:hypothetical protein